MGDVNMRHENEFVSFLLSEKTIKSEKAVQSRISKARRAMKILNIDLDTIVANDDLMYDSLIILSQNEDPAHSPMQNAVRKYYKFRNGAEFPRLKDYRRWLLFHYVTRV